MITGRMQNSFSLMFNRSFILFLLSLAWKTENCFFYRDCCRTKSLLSANIKCIHCGDDKKIFNDFFHSQLLCQRGAECNPWWKSNNIHHHMSMSSFSLFFFCWHHKIHHPGVFITRLEHHGWMANVENSDSYLIQQLSFSSSTFVGEEECFSWIIYLESICCFSCTLARHCSESYGPTELCRIIFGLLLFCVAMDFHGNFSG